MFSDTTSLDLFIHFLEQYDFNNNHGDLAKNFDELNIHMNSPPQIRNRAHRFGDIVFTKRTLNIFGNLTVYRHAGLVSQVDESSNIREIIDFDPIFDSNSSDSLDTQRILMALVGTFGKPRIVTSDMIESIFPSDTTYIHSEGPTETALQDGIRERITQSLSTNRKYLLLESNCQHFAFYLQRGRGESPDVTIFNFALRDGILNAMRVLKYQILEPTFRVIETVVYSRVNHPMGYLVNLLLVFMIVFFGFLLGVPVTLLTFFLTGTNSYFLNLHRDSIE